MLTNKNVLITGGSSGLGKELCLSFKKEGYNVFYTYYQNEPNIEGCRGFYCDLNDEKSINTFISGLYKEVKNIDILVNNAAIELNSDFNSKTKEDFLKVLNINLVGTFLLTREIGNMMYKNKKGKIINISSNNSLDKNDPVTLEYDLSKAALNSLTHNLAKQYAPFVNVNAIAPGFIMTPKIIELDNYLNKEFIKEETKNILLERFATCEDISNLVLFLASDKSNYINDQIIRIDGGSK